MQARHDRQTDVHISSDEDPHLEVKRTMSPSSLNGTVSLVTGATGGIGRATVRALVAAGGTVIATDLSGDAPDIGDVTYRQLDVTEPTAWQVVVAGIEADYGRLDNLVHCAGIELVASIAGQLWRIFANA